MFFGDVRRQVLQENARLRVEVLHGVGDDSLDVYSLNLGLIKSLGSFDQGSSASEEDLNMFFGVDDVVGLDLLLF